LFWQWNTQKIDIQLQRLAKCAESRLHSAFKPHSVVFALCYGFSNCLNGDLLPFVLIASFFHVLQTCKRKSSAFVHQILQDIPNPDLENTMPIHQQLWSLECSVVETVASLLRGVTKHCLAGIQSHRPDNVDDIQAVRKSSTKQCNSSDQRLFSAEKWKRY